MDGDGPFGRKTTEVMKNEFGPDQAALRRIAQLEEELHSLQTVVLILVARTSDDPAQAKRLAERIYDL